MAKKPDRAPSAEERALFRRAMADADPLARRETQTDDANADGTSDANPPVRSGPPSGPTRGPAPPVAPLAPAVRRPAATALEAGTADGLDRRTMDRLRKGRLRPEARLDLHGMTADAASGALSGFLGSAQAAGKRCVLVITGKGSLKAGGGVIRRELPHWLNASGNRARVLGFAQAQPADGGAGAFYVLLRRKQGGGPGG